MAIRIITPASGCLISLCGTGADHSIIDCTIVALENTIQNVTV